MTFFHITKNISVVKDGSMNIIERLSNQSGLSLSSNEREIIKQLNKFYDQIPNLTINELARLTFTSPASIYRVIKKLGFKGYSDVKYKILDDLENRKQHVFVSEDYFQQIVRNLEMTKRLNEKVIVEAAQLILQKKIKYCYGTGWKQNQIASNFSTDLLYYGESFITLRTEDDLKLTSSKMDEESLILVVSLTGNGEEYIQYIEKCKFNDGAVISITRDMPNRLSKLADIPLYFKEGELIDKHWNSLTLHFLCDYLIETIVDQKQNMM